MKNFIRVWQYYICDITTDVFIDTNLLILVLPLEMSRKYVSKMFFKGNVEIEACESAHLSQFQFTFDADYNSFMKTVKQTELYSHANCGQKG